MTWFRLRVCVVCVRVRSCGCGTPCIELFICTTNSIIHANASANAVSADPADDNMAIDLRDLQGWMDEVTMGTAQGSMMFASIADLFKVSFFSSDIENSIGLTLEQQSLE